MVDQQNKTVYAELKESITIINREILTISTIVSNIREAIKLLEEAKTASSIATKIEKIKESIKLLEGVKRRVQDPLQKVQVIENVAKVVETILQKDEKEFEEMKRLLDEIIGELENLKRYKNYIDILYSIKGRLQVLHEKIEK